MNEIKFRIFDKEKNKIRFDFIIETKSYEKDLKKCIKDYDWNILDDIEIMQYTWLKDKNWVEIYEWDILSYKKGKWFFEIVDKWFVRYENWWYRLYYPNINWKEFLLKKDFFYNDFGKSGENIYEYWYEVIWNIYENMDLFKIYEHVSFDFNKKEFVKGDNLRLARIVWDDKIYLDDFNEYIIEYYIRSTISWTDLWILTNLNKVYYQEKGYDVLHRWREEIFEELRIKNKK